LQLANGLTVLLFTFFFFFSYHSLSHLSIDGAAQLGGTLLLNGSLGVWPLASALGVSEDAHARGNELWRVFAAMPSSFGIGEDAMAVLALNTSQQTAATAAVGNNTSSVNESIAPPVAGTDALPLLTARGGLLPLSSPQHFASVQLGALFDLLPAGLVLDVSYDDGNVTVGSGGLVTMPAQTSVSLRTYGAAYAPPNKRSDSNKTSGAPSQAQIVASVFIVVATTAGIIILLRVWI
jgi:hypothetical protein